MTRFPLGRLLVVLALLGLAANVAAAGTWPPNPPPLPAKGGTFTDPTWGTLIMRVTDASDGRDNTVAYSYWPTFAKDNLHFFISSSTGDAYLYHFDPVNFELVGEKEPLFASYPPGETRYPHWEDTIWSGISTTEVFCHGRYLKLYSYDVETKEWTLIHDFDGETTAYSLWQMTKSIDDNVFGFTLCNSTGAKIGYMAWKRDTNEILVHLMDSSLDEVHIDKSGEYCIKWPGSSEEPLIVHDLVGSTQTSLTDGPPDYRPGHADQGTGTLVGWERWLNRVLTRDLATPHEFSLVVDRGDDWSQDYHISMLADDESMVLISSYDSGHFTSPDDYLRQEVFQVTMDGTQTVTHICHHYSNVKNYWDSPRANISRDGKFAAFTSNWGTRQRDVFIAKLAVGPEPPVADFSGNPRSGNPPLTVAFTDLSSGNPTSWDWSFGDGGTSQDQHPSHEYTAVNSYTVSLTAANAQGEDTETKPGYITVSNLSCHVGSIELVGKYKSTGPPSGRGYYAEATITVHDQDCAARAGVTVDITWSGCVSGTDSDVTDENGQVVFNSPTNPDGGTFTCTVDNLTKDGYAYNSGANHETSDSIQNP